MALDSSCCRVIHGRLGRDSRTGRFEGSNAAVYPATCTLFPEESLALKVLFNYGSESYRDMRERFQQNYRIPEKLPPHSCIIHVYGHFMGNLTDFPLSDLDIDHTVTRSHTMFVLMELASRSLRSHLYESQGGMPLQPALEVVRSVLSAVVHLKAHQVVHCDLKSDNIVKIGERWCVIDFSEAKDWSDALYQRFETFKIDNTPGLQKGGAGVVMAPEIYKMSTQLQLDYSRMDEFAIGCLCYELAGLNNPFEQDQWRCLGEFEVDALPQFSAAYLPLWHIARELLHCDPRQRASASQALRMTEIALYYIEQAASFRTQLRDELIAALAEKTAVIERLKGEKIDLQVTFEQLVHHHRFNNEVLAENLEIARIELQQRDTEMSLLRDQLLRSRVNDLRLTKAHSFLRGFGFGDTGNRSAVLTPTGWQYVAALQTPFSARDSALVHAVSENKVVLVEGKTQLSAILDLHFCVWRELPRLPHPLHAPFGFVCDSHVYIVSNFGIQYVSMDLRATDPQWVLAGLEVQCQSWINAWGQTLYGLTDEAELLAYNLVSRAVRKLTAHPNRVHHGVSSLVAGDALFLAGGYNKAGVIQDAFVKYDLASNQWLSLRSLPRACAKASLVMHDERLYLLGGTDGQWSLDDVYSYDLKTDSWRRESPLPEPALRLCVVSV